MYVKEVPNLVIYLKFLVTPAAVVALNGIELNIAT
jgi:hypothetical protein